MIPSPNTMPKDFKSVNEYKSVKEIHLPNVGLVRYTLNLQWNNVELYSP